MLPYDKIRSLFIVAILTIISFCSYSQISGIVLTPADDPIPNVNLYCEKYKVGTSTDKDGIFSLIVKPDAVIEISCVGYNSETLYVSELENKENASVIIRLYPSLKEISGVIIESEAYKRLNKNKEFFIGDIEIIKGMLLVLGKRQNQQQLLAIMPSLDFDTVCQSVVNNKIFRIYKDCFHNIHLVSKDSVYQVNIDKSGLKIVHTSSYKEFFSIFAALFLYDNKNLYSYNLDNFAQTINYYKYNTLTKEKSLLCSGTDQANYKAVLANRRDMVREQRFKSYFDNYSQEEQIYIPEGMREEDAKIMISRLETIAEIKNKSSQRRDMYSNYLFNRPIRTKFNPLFYFNDTLSFISTAANQIQLFDTDGNNISTIDTDFKIQGKKIFDIQLDSSTGKYYCIYLGENGVVEIYELSLVTGKMSLVKIISHIVYPDKVKIYDGNLFLVHNEFFGSGSLNKQLTYLRMLE